MFSVLPCSVLPFNLCLVGNDAVIEHGDLVPF